MMVKPGTPLASRPSVYASDQHNPSLCVRASLAGAGSAARAENGLELAGNIEGYLTPRMSIRGQLGTAWLDVTGRGVSVRPLFFDGNIVYNWEGGQWHPYVTGGVGFYRYHVERGSAEADDKNAGFDLGGGFEYFFRRRATITGELLYHNVGDVMTRLAAYPDGSFWTFAIGGKAYFGR